MRVKIPFIFFVLFNYAFANSNYDLVKIYGDNVFTNVVINNDNAYVSSNKGLYIINFENLKLELYDESIKGEVNSDLTTKSSIYKIEFLKPPIQIPKEYKNTLTDFAYIKNHLVLISRGKILLYKNNPFQFLPYGSVRTISKNAIGTYNGIFINGNKLKKPLYTDGQIKEIDSTFFICYNGIIEYRKSKAKIIYDNDNSKFSNSKLGNISDIFSINDSTFLVLSSKGLYKYNNKKNIFSKVYSKENEIKIIRNKINDRIKNNNEFHFIDGEKYISINILDFSKRVVYENIPDEIIDILECSIDGNVLYAIGKNKSLLKLRGSKNRIKLLKEYKLNNSAHTVSDYMDLIFISGDGGLSVFVKSIEKTHQQLIIDEFNKNAVFKSENQISFGSIHGVYKINDINELIKSSYLTNLDNYNQSEYNYENLIVIFVVLLFLLSTGIFKTKKISNEELVFEIKKYINKNLKTVTLNSLEDKFNLDYSAINNLQNEFRPAKYIKNKRNEIAKEMFLNGEKVSKISKKTGYSESYLTKNKYSFTRK